MRRARVSRGVFGGVSEILGFAAIILSVRILDAMVTQPDWIALDWIIEERPALGFERA